MNDSRFSALSKDPRYRLPSRKEARTAVDPRFKTLFTDQEFRKKASVDRYGRKIKPKAGKKELERLYQLDKKDRTKSKGTDAKRPERDVVGSSGSEEEDEDEDEEEATVRDPAREGFSGSESSEEETSDEEDSESDEEALLAEDTAGQEQTESIPMGEVSRRIACVNLDWDNIRAADIMAVAQSFAPTGGRVENVTIYPSEFGRERLEREEIEGPPREIFASTSSKKQQDDDEDDDSSDDDEKIKEQLLKEQANEGEEFNSAALRQYQLERLRYYYAVMECDSKKTAKAIYDSMDGREYLTTSNFFDLRFVPDETSFDEDKPHDECNSLPNGYKPNDFRTEALTHSKVRLTWDDDDPARKEVQKRAFSRAEMDENDLQAYIGSDDSDADSVSSRKSTAEDRKAKKKEAQRQKMREALGLSAEPTKTKKDQDDVTGDMQITFTSGLGGGKDGKSVFENEPQDEESTRARYIRKEKERKQKRKEKLKIRNGETEEKSDDEQQQAGAEDAEDDPFNDPFFNDPELASKQEKAAKKAARKAKQDAKEAQDAEAESRRAELELLMAEEDGEGVRHFDMRELEKAQKAAKRNKKGKKGKKAGVEADEKDEFQVETQDPRFKDLFDSHEFAIDPTSKLYKGSEAMKQVVEEGRKRKAGKLEEEGDGVPVEAEVRKGKKSKKGDKMQDGEDVKNLVARLKSKQKNKK
ncbi:hypothetical protein PRZ48_014313 [Zasmidium cellare]|uniref:NUC153 domain-containing protein n=1 Tax=Zasmidium cellare TaxID=395010 RepID=A0ABR0E0M9_ZASCE|nr:hypothetical protein PRZ48_014313 [Zasmidium cellare]